MSDTPTTAEVEDYIKGRLEVIRTHWDALILPASSRTLGGPRGATSSRGVPPHDPVNDPLGVMVEDDHLDSEADIDRATRVVSLRRFTVDVLNGWSRVVMEDRPVTKALPDGKDALSMCRFLETHAQWLSGHEAAEDVCNELGDLAQRIRQAVAPYRKEWLYLGDCPFVIEDWFCAGRVRSRIGGETDEASCSDCGQVALVEWWEDVLGIGVDPRPVTIPALVPILRDRLKITVTERTLRNWARDGRITPLAPFGPEPKHRRFDPRVVLDQVSHMDRECPMCGREWHGRGATCARCFTAMKSARPSRAGDQRPTPAPHATVGWCPWPRNTVRDSHDTDRPERCHYSDLPLNQCACGRHTAENVDVKRSA